MLFFWAVDTSKLQLLAAGGLFIGVGLSTPELQPLVRRSFSFHVSKKSVLFPRDVFY